MKIAIVVRSRNDIAFAQHTLEALRSQRCEFQTIFCFDNSSTDGTRKMLEKFGVEIVDVAEGAYVPGKILNLAVAKTNADIYVFNNLDAIPQNENWLENLISPILKGEADIAYARQIPRKDAHLWVCSDYNHAFPEDNPSSAGFFSMASSAVSAKVFDKIHFDESLNFSEDVMLVKTASEQNFKIIYANKSVVEHSHNYDKQSIIRRFTGEGVADRKICKGKFTLLDAIRRALVDIFRDVLFAFKTGKIAEIPNSFSVRFLQKMSYYKGRRVGK